MFAGIFGPAPERGNLGTPGAFYAPGFSPGTLPMPFPTVGHEPRAVNQRIWNRREKLIQENPPRPTPSVQASMGAWGVPARPFEGNRKWLSGHHEDAICTGDFSTLATQITSFLQRGEVYVAMEKIKDCASVRSRRREIDADHQRAINLLNYLYKTLQQLGTKANNSTLRWDRGVWGFVLTDPLGNEITIYSDRDPVQTRSVQAPQQAVANPWGQVQPQVHQQVQQQLQQLTPQQLWGAFFQGGKKRKTRARRKQGKKTHRNRKH